MPSTQPSPLATFPNAHSQDCLSCKAHMLSIPQFYLRLPVSSDGVLLLGVLRNTQTAGHTHSQHECHPQAARTPGCPDAQGVLGQPAQHSPSTPPDRLLHNVMTFVVISEDNYLRQAGMGLQSMGSGTMGPCSSAAQTSQYQTQRTPAEPHPVQAAYWPVYVRLPAQSAHWPWP